MKVFLVLTLVECSTSAISLFLSFFANRTLHFRRIKIDGQCLYLKLFSTAIYGKVDFNFLVLFELFLLVNKLHELGLKIIQQSRTCSVT